MSLDPRLAEAEQLAAGGRSEDAIALLRTLSAGGAGFRDASVALAYLLIAANRPAEAVNATRIAVRARDADIHIITAHAAALAAAGRRQEAIAAYERGVQTQPRSGVAEHNLAAALGDAQRFPESRAASGRAMAKGLDAIETWLVHARALVGVGEYDDAERAYGRIIARRPELPAPHADLAQLRWRRTQDPDAASASLDAALIDRPGDTALSLAKAKVLEFTGRRSEAYAILVDALKIDPSEPRLHVEAAALIGWTDGALALQHAEEAAKAAPGRGDTLAALCQANLAAGRPEVAAQIAEDLRAGWPTDQYAVALLATAWRLMGDDRYGKLFDYERLVWSSPIDVPKGWSSLESYLADLARVLETLQILPGHPIGQSLRTGGQTGQTLTLSDDPTVRAFFTAVRGPIQAYVDRLRETGERLGRPTVDKGWRFDSAWSSRLRTNGFHVDHLHPLGWISSACHIVVPKAVDQDHQGWLKFGQPGIPTSPPLPAEHFVKPEAGRLVLFPSYMWHGTAPFSGDAQRLTIAFDVLPD